MKDFETQLAQARRLYPGLRRGVQYEKEFFDCWLDTWSGPGRPRVLDAGCGFQYGLVSKYENKFRSVGLDIDHTVVRKNQDIDLRVVSSCEMISFAPESFDLIVSRFVMEHLTDPGQAFREFHRVLRPGGALLFSTVNTMNPGIWSIRMVPMWLRDRVRSASFGAELAGNAPTYYRANTPGSIRNLLMQTGFELQLEEFFPSFMWYFRFSTPLLLTLAAANGMLSRLHLTRFYGGLVYGAVKQAAP